MVERILQTLVNRLAEMEHIELCEGASVEELSTELIRQLSLGTEHGTGFIGW